ncbi:MAG: ABC transporter ATP-binding protein, partial [Oscillospiraceae bacterium]|nr:ABC transporter ATP-binding protein [Oscillospiraceae bacterium]
MNLRTEKLSAGYTVRGDKRVILESADITVSRGEIVALIGPNGSGKTTLLRTLANRLAPLAGTVYLGDEDMSAMKQNTVASHLAILTTERISPALATAADIVEAGRYPYTNVLGRITAADRAAVVSALETVHAAPLADVMFD